MHIIYNDYIIIGFLFNAIQDEEILLLEIIKIYLPTLTYYDTNNFVELNKL